LIPKENKDNLHLTLPSKLSAKLMDDDFVSFLKTEKNEKEICKAILKTMG
jgi:mannitol/fructose-specific phosphotransferase system IIA component (Ntr-type)